MGVGLPDGAVRERPGGRVDTLGVRAAILELAGEPDRVPSPEALLAWLRAVRHHWPQRFEELGGEAGTGLILALEAGADPNRTLKLRRIAIENLATLL